MALGVRDDEVAALFPVAVGLFTVSAAVVLWARDKAKDIARLRYNRVAETSQRDQIRGVVATTTAAFAVSLLPIVAMLPLAASVVHAALEAPRRYSTVKTGFLILVLVAAVMSVLAYVEMRKARRRRAAWRHERLAVITE
jgi:hypothetical protein